ncbi:MAG: FixH family protein [Chloroflexi bacterium]|nr:FixH family protein [Chloroflexota bacterium]
MKTASSKTQGASKDSLSRRIPTSARGAQSTILLGLTLLILVLVTACGATPSTGGSTTSKGYMKMVDGIQIQAVLNPNPPQASQDDTVEVTLTDDKGQPITDGRVAVTLSAAGMSSSVATAQHKANGVYTATLKPTGHKGTHSFTVDVQWQNKPYQAKFDDVSVQ